MSSAIQAIIQLGGALLPLIQKALTAKAEEHAQIVSDAQLAVRDFLSTLDGLSAVIAADDAAADAAAKAAMAPHAALIAETVVKG